MFFLGEMLNHTDHVYIGRNYAEQRKAEHIKEKQVNNHMGYV